MPLINFQSPIVIAINNSALNFLRFHFILLEKAQAEGKEQRGREMQTPS